MAVPYRAVEYANQSATRNRPLSHRLGLTLTNALSPFGVTARVISGGQDPAGTPNARRTGSTRHDHGDAADVDFYHNGRKLDWEVPEDRAVLNNVVPALRREGITGIGAGDDYMGRGRFHVGFGPEAVWGAGGKSANAMPWLRDTWAAAGPARGTTLTSTPLRPGSAAPALPAAQHVTTVNTMPDAGPPVDVAKAAAPVQAEPQTPLQKAGALLEDKDFMSGLSGLAKGLGLGGGGQAAPQQQTAPAPQLMAEPDDSAQRMAAALPMFASLLAKRRGRVPGLTLMG